MKKGRFEKLAAQASQSNQGSGILLEALQEKVRVQKTDLISGAVNAKLGNLSANSFTSAQRITSEHDLITSRLNGILNKITFDTVVPLTLDLLNDRKRWFFAPESSGQVPRYTFAVDEMAELAIARAFEMDCPRTAGALSDLLIMMIVAIPLVSVDRDCVPVGSLPLLTHAIVSKFLAEFRKRMLARVAAASSASGVAVPEDPNALSPYDDAQTRLRRAVRFVALTVAKMRMASLDASPSPAYVSFLTSVLATTEGSAIQSDLSDPIQCLVSGIADCIATARKNAAAEALRSGGKASTAQLVEICRAVERGLPAADDVDLVIFALKGLGDGAICVQPPLERLRELSTPSAPFHPVKIPRQFRLTEDDARIALAPLFLQLRVLLERGTDTSGTSEKPIYPLRVEVLVDTLQSSWYPGEYVSILKEAAGKHVTVSDAVIPSLADGSNDSVEPASKASAFDAAVATVAERLLSGYLEGGFQEMSAVAEVQFRSSEIAPFTKLSSEDFVGLDAAHLNIFLSQPCPFTSGVVQRLVHDILARRIHSSAGFTQQEGPALLRLLVFLSPLYNHAAAHQDHFSTPQVLAVLGRNWTAASEEVIASHFSIYCPVSVQFFVDVLTSKTVGIIVGGEASDLPGVFSRIVEMLGTVVDPVLFLGRSASFLICVLKRCVQGCIDLGDVSAFQEYSLDDYADLFRVFFRRFFVPAALPSAIASADSSVLTAFQLGLVRFIFVRSGLPELIEAHQLLETLNRIIAVSIELEAIPKSIWMQWFSGSFDSPVGKLAQRLVKSCPVFRC